MTNNALWAETKTLLIAAVAFIPALAWNSAFQNTFEHVPLLKMGGPWVYAIFVTAIGIGIAFLLRDQENKDDDKS